MCASLGDLDLDDLWALEGESVTGVTHRHNSTESATGREEGDSNRDDWQCSASRRVARYGAIIHHPPHPPFLAALPHCSSSYNTQKLPLAAATLTTAS